MAQSSMLNAHIYTFSRLVHARAIDWQRMLTSMEEGKPFAFSYYLPMREAVVRFCHRRGVQRERTANELAARAGAGPRGPKRRADNLAAFETFADAFYPKMGRFRRDLLRHQRPDCEFEGIALEGGPHFEANDKKGNRRYAFLHAASWERQDLAAYLELLAVIVKETYGGDDSSLWIMDLKTGKEIKWKSRVRVRRACEDAAKLYARLFSKMGNPAAR